VRRSPNGLSREEIREVILQVGLYRDVPVAKHGTALLRETLGDSSGG
jgi:alkylhydroperoxidase/carboxymuconolactone decarboxylase family protein YurZ